MNTDKEIATANNNSYRWLGLVVSMVLLGMSVAGCSGATTRDVDVNAAAVQQMRDADSDDERFALLQTQLVTLRTELAAVQQSLEFQTTGLTQVQARVQASEGRIVRLTNSHEKAHQQMQALQTDLAEWRGLAGARGDQLRDLQVAHTLLATQFGELQKELTLLRGDVNARPAPPVGLALECKLSKVMKRSPFVSLDKGTEAGVAVDDMFDIFDGKKRVGRVKVFTVYDSFSTATILQEVANTSFQTGQRAVRTTR